MSEAPAASAPVVDGAYATAIQFLDRGESPSAVEQRLIGMGVGSATAKRIVAEEVAVRAQAKAPDGATGRSGNDMVIGGIICAIGVVVTVVSMSAASNGGTYVVAWGAILFGGIRFFRGVANR